MVSELENKGTITINIRQYLAALNDILQSLPESDKDIAFHALQGIEAETERVNGLETVVSIGFEMAVR